MFSAQQKITQAGIGSSAMPYALSKKPPGPLWIEVMTMEVMQVARKYYSRR